MRSLRTAMQPPRCGHQPCATCAIEIAGSGFWHRQEAHLYPGAGSSSGSGNRRLICIWEEVDKPPRWGGRATTVRGAIRQLNHVPCAGANLRSRIPASLTNWPPARERCLFPGTSPRMRGGCTVRCTPSPSRWATSPADRRVTQFATIPTLWVITVLRCVRASPRGRVSGNLGAGNPRAGNLGSGNPGAGSVGIGAVISAPGPEADGRLMASAGFGSTGTGDPGAGALTASATGGTAGAAGLGAHRPAWRSSPTPSIVSYSARPHCQPRSWADNAPLIRQAMAHGPGLSGTDARSRSRNATGAVRAR